MVFFFFFFETNFIGFLYYTVINCHHGSFFQLGLPLFLDFHICMTLSWDWNDFCHAGYLFLFFSFCFLFVTTDDVCKGVVCGKGTCKPSNQSAFFLFECECDPGWKQANFGLAENFKFLPCVVPNCKSSLSQIQMDYVCVNIWLQSLTLQKNLLMNCFVFVLLNE